MEEHIHALAVVSWSVYKIMLNFDCVGDIISGEEKYHKRIIIGEGVV